MRKMICLAFFFSWLAVLSAQKPFEEIKKTHNRKRDGLDSSGWKPRGFFLLNVNQAALSDWSGGGEQFLIGINTNVNYALHHRKGKYSMDGYLDLELGFIEAASFKTFRKTVDRLDLTVEMEHTLGKKTFYGLLFNFNSQLFPGHDYKKPEHDKISNFLSPGKFLLAPGVERKSQREHYYFSLFFSPAALKWVTKTDPDFYRTSKFGVDSAHRVNLEFGTYLSTHYQWQLSKVVQYIGRLDLFSNYKRNPEHIDVLMNNLLMVNISNSFAVNVLLDIIYDDDIKSRTQVQELFGLGLKLKL